MPRCAGATKAAARPWGHGVLLRIAGGALTIRDGFTHYPQKQETYRWREIPLEWKGTNQRPIPEAWRQIGSRTSLFQLAGNRNAAHPVNAMLNYAYAILEKPGTNSERRRRL